MTGKELVLHALRNGECERTPWVPFVGCHAGQLINVTAREYLQSSDLIVKGVSEAVARYRPDGIPVVFDLQIEAECLGCELAWSDDNPPAVSSHPLETQELSTLHVPGADEGRFPLVLDATRRLREAHPDVALYGLITGPFTLALHLVGANIFMQMFDQPDEVKQVLAFCREVAEASARYYSEAGCDIVALVDPMTSQIGPEHFREFVTPYVTPVFEQIRAAGRLSSFFVCGHAQANIEEMCRTWPDNVSVDENIQLSYVRDVCTQHGLSFGGNLQLTIVLLFGTKEDCMRNTMDCMTVGGTRGFILAPGCDIPYATPPENLEAVASVVHDEYQREVAKTLMEQSRDLAVDLDMSDYGKLDKVVIDVVTLDSEACAPCQYMCEAVQAVVPHFEDLVIWREHKIKLPDEVEFMSALMVRNIPTICIDGEIVFVSRIPGRDELIAAIQDRINRKMRSYFRRRTAAVAVLGDGCEACDETLENVRKAIKELGMEVAVRHITDDEEIARYGVDETPAVVIVERAVKSTGKVPKVEIVKEWLKDLHL